MQIHPPPHVTDENSGPEFLMSKERRKKEATSHL